MQVPFLDLKSQYHQIKPEIDQAISEVIESARFVGGERVERFEQVFARFCGSSYALGMNSGTAALQLALLALGLKPGQEVILPANTFMATAEAVTHAGGNIALVDADPKTYTMDVSRIEEAINKNTWGIMPVHLYGHPADMDPILKIARKHGIRVVEDCAQSHGARYKGRRVGQFGDAAGFSFYPGKNLGAYGDGGLVTTDDQEALGQMKLLFNHGRNEKGEHEIEGFNERLDTLQAAILEVKLRHLDDWNAARRAHADHYRERLSGAHLVLPQVDDDVEHVYHLFVVRLENRDEVVARLKEKGIGVGIHYDRAVHTHKAYEYLGVSEGTHPVSEACAREVVSLPMYAELGDKQVDAVCDALIEVLG
ncbi:MAG: DegT/DnrJ/EryC1/StrS family aminotransferase [Candidatus Eisenbacteria sp.]|nr:DegT/DnrJ/EryC1/StrS family aminotransferase [Candidatus Eisenbacteria bacterium]